MVTFHFELPLILRMVTCYTVFFFKLSYNRNHFHILTTTTYYCLNFYDLLLLFFSFSLF